MARAQWTACYVGHGALNRIDIIDDDNQVEHTIIIDAGSNEDKFILNGFDTRAKVAGQELIKYIKQCGDKSVTMCLTHIHDDHYSFFLDLLQDDDAREKIECFYIGSVCEKPDEINSKFWQAIISSNLNFDILEEYNYYKGKYNQPRPLWTDSENEFELWLLFNCLCTNDGNNVNQNSANYLFKTPSSATWFTGDSTGWTFSVLLNNKHLCEGIKDIIHQCCKINITVPHHGSSHSLAENDFIFIPGDGKADVELNDWNELCIAIGIEKYNIIASFGIEDSNGHPSGYAMFIYAYGVPMDISKKGLFYNAYRQSRNEPVVFCARTITKDMYLQHFLNRPGVKVTCCSCKEDDSMNYQDITTDL